MIATGAEGRGGGDGGGGGNRSVGWVKRKGRRASTIESNRQIGGGLEALQSLQRRQQWCDRRPLSLNAHKRV